MKSEIFSEMLVNIYTITQRHILASVRIWNLTFLHLSYFKFLHLITHHISDLQQLDVQENEIIHQRFQSKKGHISAQVVFFVAVPKLNIFSQLE